MRTIEFRMWSNEAKRFFHDVENVFECLMQQNVSDRIMKTSFTLPYDHRAEGMIWEQFTGLPDKHKNKIFEGDILSAYTQTDEGVVKSFQQVFWCEKNGAWMLDESYKQDKSASRLLSMELRIFDYEVSGNIHENPELLQVE